MVCPVAGYPIKSVTWTLHGRPLSPKPRRSPRADGSLVFQSVEAEQDVGRYTCTASNAQGRTATASFILDVLSEWRGRRRRRDGLADAAPCVALDDIGIMTSIITAIIVIVINCHCCCYCCYSLHYHYFLYYYHDHYRHPYIYSQYHE